mgnify:CR=1 FL=1
MKITRNSSETRRFSELCTGDLFVDITQELYMKVKSPITNAVNISLNSLHRFNETGLVSLVHGNLKVSDEIIVVPFEEIKPGSTFQVERSFYLRLTGVDSVNLATGDLEVFPKASWVHKVNLSLEVEE